ncbi:MAG: hypothetical protein U0520_04065 [Candidatus Saccharimonadales bacterium]
MLELSSNTIKVLGIFGRLSTEQEAFFDELEKNYSQKPEGDQYSIFRHLTLTFIPDATIKDLNNQLTLLKDLRKFLPLKINVKNAFVKNEESLPGAEHVAIEFELSETHELVKFIKKRCDKYTVATWYIKVVWFLPDIHHETVIDQVLSIKELEFTDFYLCTNKQNDVNTVFKTSQFAESGSL